MKKTVIVLALTALMYSFAAMATTPCSETFTTAGLTTTAVTAPIAQTFTESSPSPTITDVSATLTYLTAFSTGAAPTPACSSTGEDIVIEEQQDVTENVEGIIRTNDYVAVITTDLTTGGGLPRDKIRIRCKLPNDFSTVVNDVEVDVSPTEIVNPTLASGFQAGTNKVVVGTHLFNGNLLVLSYDCGTDTLDQARLGGFTFLGSSGRIMKNGAGVYFVGRESSGNLIVIKLDSTLSSILAAQSYDLLAAIISPQITTGGGFNPIIVAGHVTGVSDLLLISFDADLGFQGNDQIDLDVTIVPPSEIINDLSTNTLVIAGDEFIVSADTSSFISLGVAENSFETSTDGGVIADIYLENSKVLAGGLTLNFLGAIGEWGLVSGTGLVPNYWNEDPDNQILKVIKDANGKPWAIGFSLADSTKVAISKYDTDGSGISYTTGALPFDFLDIGLALDRDTTGLYAAYSYRDSLDLNPTDTYAIKINAPLDAEPVPEFSSITLLLAGLVALAGMFVLRRKF